MDDAAGLVTTFFHQPAVRHLAWLCLAPPLLQSDLNFYPGRHLPGDIVERLAYWDRHPERGPVELNQLPHYRLGLYVESLYECLLRDVLGWEVLARNLPVRHQGVTLGELDFVVRNPRTGANEHHEIAIKFYLGYPSRADNDRPPLWYGPNSRDRLDIKAHRMLEVQSQRTDLAQAQATLQELGIEAPSARRIFMPGYLFYPSHARLPASALADPAHLQGHWLYLHQARGQAIQNGVLLQKPHWLGPWFQHDRPEPAVVANAMEDIKHTGTPRLFASLAYDGALGLWRETSRFFVVPDTWPGPVSTDQDSSITTRSI